MSTTFMHKQTHEYTKTQGGSSNYAYHPEIAEIKAFALIAN